MRLDVCSVFTIVVPEGIIVECKYIFEGKDCHGLVVFRWYLIRQKDVRAEQFCNEKWKQKG